MISFRHICRFSLVAFLTAIPTLAFSVTQKEMEQARTIAAKCYIRWVNNGSGYLDEINPTTMEELEKSLKPKEIENIKAFKAIPVPTDYQSWDKAKLVEYWAVTAFQNKGLQEAGRGGRIRARTLINKMNIAAPAPAQTQPAAPTENKEAAPEKPAEANVAEPASSQESIDSSIMADESLILEGMEDEAEDIDVDKAVNYTWVYIMVLAILVALIIALVVYAANVMKKNAAETERKYREEDEESEPVNEYTESLLADKDLEIAMLNKKLESATRQNNELKLKLEALASEVESLRARKPVEVEGSSGLTQTSPVRKESLRSIYLGRANAKGIFVRADRTLNIGHSLFILDTSDGYSGSFRVADSPAAWSLALSNPKEYLSYACVGYDLENTAGVSKIVTEESGTAMFEGGCWKVIRRAKIRYE